MPKISIIIPAYFCEGNISLLSRSLIENENLFDKDIRFEYIFIDDGSGDKTFDELLKFQKQYPQKTKLIKLLRNFGSNSAVVAGFRYATGDCNVILAADLQDPPELIPKMFQHWKNGIKLVIANRIDRQEPFSRKFFSGIFHALMRKYAVPKAPPGGFDLLLFDKELRDIIVKMEEKNTYIPYLLVWLGYEYITVPYVRLKREVGKSRWSLSKKIKAFIDSMVAFSFFPLRLISLLGLFTGIVAFIGFFFLMYKKWIGGNSINEWSVVTVIILFLSAVQMISLGIIGEYIWRNLDATRKRPDFTIDKVIDQTT